MNMKLLHIFRLMAVVLVIAVSSCNSDPDVSPILPPDYVDETEQPDNGANPEEGGNEETPDPSTPVYAHYIYPEVDANGRIIVAGRPPQYTDTAQYHVISVAYDIASNQAVDLTAYYAEAVGKSGDELKSAIAAIITAGFEGVTYGDARTLLQETDQDPLDASHVWCAYEENSVNATWDSGTTWNREHTWAQSKLGSDASNGTVNAASDLHNLKPEVPSINSSRSNRDFTEDDNEPNYVGTVGSAGYAPAVSDRGDVARILFYMELRWNAENDLELDSSVSQSGERRMGNLSVLLDWNDDDPVDPFEIRRNNVIYEHQRNRNPFIDHPELVEYIFGDRQNEAWDGGVVYSVN